MYDAARGLGFDQIMIEKRCKFDDTTAIKRDFVFHSIGQEDGEDNKLSAVRWTETEARSISPAGEVQFLARAHSVDYSNRLEWDAGSWPTNR